MSGLPFRCSIGRDDAIPENTTAPLCLNGAVCRVDLAVGMQYCDCPAGFIHDYTVGHFPNCGMPEYAWGFMTGVVGALSVVALFPSIPSYRSARSKVKRISGLSLLALVLNFTVMLCMFIERGSYESRLVFLFLFNMTVARTLMEGTIMFTEPVYAVMRRDISRFKKAILILEVSNALAQLGSLIPVIVFARDGNPERHNLATVIFLFVFAIGMIALGLLVIFQTRKLIKRIQSVMNGTDAVINGSSTNAKFSPLILRLTALLRSNSGMLVFFIVLLVFPIIFLALGSFPAQYILVFIMHCGVPIFTCLGGLVFGMKHTETGGYESSQVNTPSRDKVAAEPGIKRDTSELKPPDTLAVDTFSS